MKKTNEITLGDYVGYRKGSRFIVEERTKGYSDPYGRYAPDSVETIAAFSKRDLAFVEKGLSAYREYQKISKVLDFNSSGEIEITMGELLLNEYIVAFDPEGMAIGCTHVTYSVFKKIQEAMK